MEAREVFPSLKLEGGRRFRIEHLGQKGGRMSPGWQNGPMRSKLQQRRENKQLQKQLLNNNYIFNLIASSIIQMDD